MHTLISASLAVTRDAKAATFFVRFTPVLKPPNSQAASALDCRVAFGAGLLASAPASAVTLPVGRADTS
jgi:hypothetical protein